MVSTMRTNEQPRTAGNDVQVFCVNWTYGVDERGEPKRTSSCWTTNKAKAERLYSMKEEQDKHPVLKIEWVAGFVQSMAA